MFDHVKQLDKKTKGIIALAFAIGFIIAWCLSCCMMHHRMEHHRSFKHDYHFQDGGRYDRRGDYNTGSMMPPPGMPMVPSRMIPIQGQTGTQVQIAPTNSTATTTTPSAQ